MIGYDICNDYSQVAWYRPGMKEPEAVVFGEGDHPTQVATAICKRRGKNEWVAGEDASRCALLGDGSIVDKLLKLVSKDGTATIEGVRYTAEDLLLAFLRTTLMMTVRYVREWEERGKSSGTEPEAERQIEEFCGTDVRMLVFSLPSMERKWMDMLVRCAGKLGIARDHVRMQSHSESFAFYTASQKLDIWANDVGLFDLTREGLYFYRFCCVRGVRPNILRVESSSLEEGFSLDLLDTESGRKLADSILAPCAERVMQKRVYSAVLLSGPGFAECSEWASSFLKCVCSKRRVYMTENLFARGAAYLAADSCLTSTQYPYRLECRGRVDTSVSLEVVSRGMPRKLTLVQAGENWYDAGAEVEIFVNGKEPLELILEPMGSGARGQAPRRIPISLADFPAREGYTTRLALSVRFAAEEKLMVEVKDLGFGEIYAASGRISRQEVTLSGAKDQREERL